MVIQVLQAARLLLTLMADTVLMAEALSQERTHQKLTGQQLMQHDILQRTLLQQAYATRHLFRWLMLSVLLNLLVYM